MTLLVDFLSTNPIAARQLQPGGHGRDFGELDVQDELGDSDGGCREPGRCAEGKEPQPFRSFR